MRRRSLALAAACGLLALAGVALLLYVRGAFPAGVPPGLATVDYGPWARALRHVDSRGRVDFDALKKDRADLDAFVASLARASPRNHPELFPTADDRLAWWLNAYNALALQALLDRWPDVRGPSDLALGRFHWGLSWPVGGRRLTLKAILDGELRDGFHDARVHFAAACGDGTCAALENTPYVGDTLDPQLNDAGRRFMQQKGNVRFEGKTVHLNPLLRRYEVDFLAALPEGRRHLLQIVWAFLPDTCAERPGCETRGDLDRQCGPALDACTVRDAPVEASTRARVSGSAPDG